MNDTADLTVYRMLKGMDTDELRNEAIAYYTEMLELKKKIAEKDAHIDALRRANERLEHELQESRLYMEDGLRLQFSKDGLEWADQPLPTDAFYRVSCDGGRIWSIPVGIGSGETVKEA